MSTINNCQFYCLYHNNEVKKKSMENRFQKLGIECKFYSGITNSDKRLKYAGNKINKRQWSVTYSHLDIIHDFCYNNNNKYAIICEDDILIHQKFKQMLKKIINDFTIIELDILLLGYMLPYKINNENIISNYPLKCPMRLDAPFKYHEYPDYLCGSHMYMITKSFANYLLNKYYYNTFNGLNDYVFMVDKTIIKNGNRALLYPMLAIENDEQEDKYHKFCHKIHYNEDYV